MLGASPQPARDSSSLPHRYEDRGLRVLGVLVGSHPARQTEVDVVMDLNEESQEQLRVDAPHTGHTAVDGQELTQAAGCLGTKGRLVGCPGPSSQHPWQGTDCFTRRSDLGLLFSGPAGKAQIRTPCPTAPQLLALWVSPAPKTRTAATSLMLTDPWKNHGGGIPPHLL